MPYPQQSSTVHVETLNNELCLYDWERKYVHALNPTVATVWQLCDGETSPAQMAAQLRAQLEPGLDATQAQALVWSALTQLNEAHLLQGEMNPPVNRSLFTRRQMIKAGIAIALLPVISSILAPSPVAAQSGRVRIVLYNPGGNYNGNLGGRVGADAICVNSVNKPAGYSNYRAFISVSATDEIRDMPTNYLVPTTLPITGPGPGFTQIASNWASLVDGNIDATLQAALISGASWWSGSQANASVNGTCSGWTTSSSGSNGSDGHYNAIDGNWINSLGATCDQSRQLLCIAF